MGSFRCNRLRAGLAAVAAAVVAGAGVVAVAGSPGPAGTAAPADDPGVVEQLGSKVRRLLGQETPPPVPTGPECGAWLRSDAEDRCRVDPRFLTSRQDDSP